MKMIQRTGMVDAPRFLKMLLCGDPGKGKTLFSSTAPNPLYLSAEGGTMSIDDRHIPTYPIDSTAELLAMIKILQASPIDRARHLRKLDMDAAIDTVVVDTIDEVARIIGREWCEDKKLDQLDLKGYGHLAKQMTSLVNALRNLDLHVIMTCHLKSRKDDEGKSSIIPAIDGQFSEQIAGYVDVAALLESAATTEIVNNRPEKVVHRWLQLYADPMHSWIKDRSGKLPLEVDINFADDFMHVAHMIWPNHGPTLSTVTPEEVEAYRQKILDAQQSDAGTGENEAPAVPQPEAAAVPQTPVVEPAPDQPGETVSGSVGLVSAKEAKKQVFAAAHQDIDKAAGAWSAAGLAKKTEVTQADLDEALRLAALPIST